VRGGVSDADCCRPGGNKSRIVKVDQESRIVREEESEGHVFKVTT
jgi:hypothetical protein